MGGRVPLLAASQSFTHPNLRFFPPWLGWPNPTVKLAGFRSMSPQSKKRVVRGLVSSMFLVFLIFKFFIHGLRRFDSLFRISGENDVCDVCMYICTYICTHTCLYEYIRTCRWILLVKVSNLWARWCCISLVDTSPFLAARLPLVLTSVTPSLCRNNKRQ